VEHNHLIIQSVHFFIVLYGDFDQAKVEKEKNNKFQARINLQEIV